MPDADEVAAAIARNARELRTERQWSLDQLATRAGVSKGMLVQIEQARTNPSIATLCRLADAFGVSLAQLVELSAASTVRVVEAADVVITMGCGDACPVFPGKRYLDWELTDPAGKAAEQIRPIRDDIDARVRHLLAELTGTPTEAVTS